jgi:hypothetical protein
MLMNKKAAETNRNVGKAYRKKQKLKRIRKPHRKRLKAVRRRA